MIEVRVMFSGIVLTVLHPGTQETAVLMPDCRSELEHVDGTTGEPHIGYLRFNLADHADITDGFPRGDHDAPSYEVVHQLDGEELVFDVQPEEWDLASAQKHFFRATPAIFNEIAPGLQPKGQIFSARPGKGLLFRTLLSGGEFTGENIGATQWIFPSTLFSPVRKASVLRYVDAFAMRETWVRRLNRADLPIRLVRLDNESETLIRLRPGSDNVITLKLGNLCAHNVLEWSWFNRRFAAEDLDFKWYYRLLDLDPDVLVGSELPYPRLHERRAKGPEGLDMCGRACIIAPFDYRETRPGATTRWVK
jgi:hypothetical protein